MIPHDDLISAVITPLDASSKRYRIAINNNSTDTLLECEFDQKWLLHPGQFGLDDTHMPSDIWTPEPLRCDVLPARSGMSFEVDGYDVPGAHDVAKSTWTQMTFRRLGANAPEPGDREQRTVDVRLDWVTVRG